MIERDAAAEASSIAMSIVLAGEAARASSDSGPVKTVHGTAKNTWAFPPATPGNFTRAPGARLRPPSIAGGRNWRRGRCLVSVDVAATGAARWMASPGCERVRTGLEHADLVDPVMDLGVGGVLANAADGPTQDLGAAAPDARGVARTVCPQHCARAGLHNT